VAKGTVRRDAVRQPALASRGCSTRGRSLFTETKPHECDRLKHIGRLGEAKTVKVVENGADGPKRAWNPATRTPLLWVSWLARGQGA
jgi:hypothetical protein